LDCDKRFVDVFSGGMQHYALTENGEVWSWGYNNYGQLGHGDTANRAQPKRIEYFMYEQYSNFQNYSQPSECIMIMPASCF
jgi:alpha-tubulin suppressor-like RCC1 family protein